MPELPEVETIRRDLYPRVINKKIVKISVTLPRIVRGSLADFQKVLTGNRITDINRIGKLLIMKLASGKFLLTHLKMTGQLIYCDNKDTIAGGHSYTSDSNQYPNSYTHVTIRFIGAAELYFNDMRTFGYMEIVDRARLKDIKATYGIEPLTPAFTFENFLFALGTRTTTIKAALLNQKLFAGIGNIYADEICFAAHVRPSRRIPMLTSVEKMKLFRASELIIKQAILYRGTTFNNYRDSLGRHGNFVKHLKVFGREGKDCIRCRQGVIKKTKVAGRGTHYCPYCQK